MAAANLVLKAQARTERGKEWAKKARRKGLLPAVVYGAGEPVAITLDQREFQLLRQATRGENLLLSVEIAGGERAQAFIKDIQRDPVTEAYLHVDMLRVDPDKVVHLPVRVRVIGGIPLGVKDGGLLEHIRNHVNIEALPAKVPAHIEVDLTDLGAHQSFHVSDLPQIEGVTYLDRPETVLYSIVAKGTGAAAEEPAAAAAATPAAGTPAAAAPAAPAKK